MSLTALLIAYDSLGFPCDGPICCNEKPLTLLLWEGLIGPAGRQNLDNLVKALQEQVTEDLNK